MDTKKVNLRKGLEEDVFLSAGEVLRSGGTVAFPTETVYGLGADALNPSAVKKSLKQREDLRTTRLLFMWQIGTFLHMLRKSLKKRER